jgi:hypothetical protein
MFIHQSGLWPGQLQDVCPGSEPGHKTPTSPALPV